MVGTSQSFIQKKNKVDFCVNQQIKTVIYDWMSRDVCEAIPSHL